jgi:hypothetical protein
MLFNPSLSEIKAFNDSVSAVTGTPKKKLNKELKKDMSYYFVIDVTNFNILDHKGLSNFFILGNDSNISEIILKHIVPTSFFFYMHSAMSIYSLLIKEQRFKKEMADSSYTIEYLVKNKYGKVMHVKQMTIALELDGNDLLVKNLTRCIVMDHEYKGTLLRDFTPKINVNFTRIFEVEEEIKARVATAFYLKMKAVHEAKYGKWSSEERKELVFTPKEVEYLKVIAQKGDENTAKIMGVSEDRIKQYKKGIKKKMENIFEWPENTIKKFENLIDFMDKNGLLKIKEIDLLYPKGS